MEQHKRKAVESAQTAADLKLHLDKYHSQLKEAQNLVSDKTEALQQQAYKYKRIQVCAGSGPTGHQLWEGCSLWDPP